MGLKVCLGIAQLDTGCLEFAAEEATGEEVTAGSLQVLMDPTKSVQLCSGLAQQQTCPCWVISMENISQDFKLTNSIASICNFRLITLQTYSWN